MSLIKMKVSMHLCDFLNSETYYKKDLTLKKTPAPS